ncbi:hypothetical protein WJX72_009899 [[Myrmecia] bisecta]|uniref:Phosphodiesterase n=1 Tax=[Myrmecia] bisecta TaxID=41462 RepID=A0AAW1QSD2_9CHLO
MTASGGRLEEPRSEHMEDAAALLRRSWTVDDLQLFEHVDQPVLVGTLVEDESMPGVPWSGVDWFFCNSVARHRFGHLLSRAERLAAVAAMTDAQQEERKRVLLQAHRAIRAGQTAEFRNQDTLAANSKFSDVSADLLFHVTFKPINLAMPNGAFVRGAFGELKETSPSQIRMVSMHQASPIMHFLFAETGELLQAGQKAIGKYRIPQGAGPGFMHLLRNGDYPGGEADMLEVKREAWEAIFVRKDPMHCFTQRYYSTTHRGRPQYILFEMWPMPDPVFGKPAVLVSTLKTTQLKELELELEGQNKHHTSVLHNEKERRNDLLMANDLLSLKLESAMRRSSTCHHVFDSDTPADKAMALLQHLLQGGRPTTEELLDLYDTFVQSSDLRQPQQLEDQLLHHETMDQEVGLSIIHLLKGAAHSQAAGPAVFTPAEMSPSTSGSLDTSLSNESRSEEACSRPDRHQAGMMPNEKILYASLTSSVERALQAAESQWQFNVNDLDAVAPGASLSMLCFWLLKHNGFIEEFQLHERHLARWLLRIEAAYKDNPYHNSKHAANVLQAVHMLHQHGGLRQHGISNNLQTMASYIAATVHDFEHPGVNNDFLVRTHHEFALTHNNIAPLENHHVSAAWKLLRMSQYNFLKALPRNKQEEIRREVIDQVLATNMTSHFNIISRFQGVYQRRKSLNSSNALMKVQRGALRSLIAQPPPAGLEQEPAWDLFGEADKSLARQIALKTADLGHLASPLAVHLDWTQRLGEEMFLQGDLERTKKMVISPLMDRSNKGVHDSQVDFFRIIAFPMFSSYTDVFPKADLMLKSAIANFNYWRYHDCDRA